MRKLHEFIFGDSPKITRGLLVLDRQITDREIIQLYARGRASLRDNAIAAHDRLIRDGLGNTIEAGFMTEARKDKTDEVKLRFYRQRLL